jgi:hypothetical protein
MMILVKLLELRHSGEGRNPVYLKIPAKRDSAKVLSALRDIHFCWIPAFAGMTECLDFV